MFEVFNEITSPIIARIMFKIGRTIWPSQEVKAWQDLSLVY
jgi:hypothetical protein